MASAHACSTRGVTGIARLQIPLISAVRDRARGGDIDFLATATTQKETYTKARFFNADLHREICVVLWKGGPRKTCRLLRIDD